MAGTHHLLPPRRTPTNHTSIQIAAEDYHRKIQPVIHTLTELVELEDLAKKSWDTPVSLDVVGKKVSVSKIVFKYHSHYTMFVASSSPSRRTDTPAAPQEEQEKATYTYRTRFWSADIPNSEEEDEERIMRVRTSKNIFDKYVDPDRASQLSTYLLSNTLTKILSGTHDDKESQPPVQGPALGDFQKTIDESITEASQRLEYLRDARDLGGQFETFQHVLLHANTPDGWVTFGWAQAVALICRYTVRCQVL